MEVKAKIKKFGDNNWTEKRIILPDFCSTLLDKYQFDIVEYHNIKVLVIFFQAKDNPDVDVVAMPVQRPELQSNIAEGFKRGFERLAELSNIQILQPELSGFAVVSA